MSTKKTVNNGNPNEDDLDDVTVDVDDVDELTDEELVDLNDLVEGEQGTEQSDPAEQTTQGNSGGNSGGNSRSNRTRQTPQTANVLPQNQLFADMLGREILLVMQADQLNILGQTFRPIFTGTVTVVTDGFLTLDPAIIKMSNAPFFRFPTPLQFPLEQISTFVPFDADIRFPIP